MVCLKYVKFELSQVFNLFLKLNKISTFCIEIDNNLIYFINDTLASFMRKLDFLKLNFKCIKTIIFKKNMEFKLSSENPKTEVRINDIRL